MDNQPDLGTNVDFQCPTCSAIQKPSTTCRRCNCDLTLVASLHGQLQELRDRCHALLRQRRLLAATRIAQQCCDLSADESNARLLATCYLLQGDFSKAVRVYTNVRPAAECLD